MAVSSRQKDQSKRHHDHLLSCTRRVEEIVKESTDVETEVCSLVGNSGSDRQPVKMSEHWGDLNMWGCTDYKMGCTVLYSLKFADQGA